MIPYYEFLIDENDEGDGVKAVSLVTSPAMQSKFIAFSDDKPKRKYVALQTDEKEYKQVVLGVVMQPELPIYRVDEETGEEYYGKFSAETIEKIVHKFHKEQVYTDDVNLQHDAKTTIKAYMFMDYIVDSELQLEDLKAKGIDDAVIGSWIAAYKIEDKEVFQQVLDGEFQGFSIEIFLDRELRGAFSKVPKINKNESKDFKKMKKSLVQKVKDKFNTIMIELEKENMESALVPELNVTLTWGEVGEAVTKTYMNESDEEVTENVGEGEFTLEDGRTVVVDAESKLVEIRDAVEEAPAEEEMVEEKSGENTIAYTEVGQPVTINGEAAPEGDILLDNGATVVVDADGNLVEVKAKEEEAPAEEAAVETPAVELEEDVPAVEDTATVLDKLLGSYGDGEFSIMVSKFDGEYKWGSVSMWKDIKLAAQTKDDEITKLKAEIEALKVKLSEPIAEPVLKDKEIQGEVKELTVYEKVARRRNLPLV